VVVNATSLCRAWLTPSRRTLFGIGVAAILVFGLFALLSIQLSTQAHAKHTRGGAAPSSFAAPATKAAIDRILGKNATGSFAAGIWVGRHRRPSAGWTGVRNDPVATSMRRPRAHVAPAVVDEGLTARSRPRFPRLAESVFKRAPMSPATAPPVRQNRRQLKWNEEGTAGCQPCPISLEQRVTELTHLSRFLLLKSGLATSGARRQT
jgi:hypothetical protein